MELSLTPHKAISDQRIKSPVLGGSDSAECATQTPANKAVTETSELSLTSENQELVSGLFSDTHSDPDLRGLIEAWPELPEHIKAAIKALAQTSSTQSKEISE